MMMRMKKMCKKKKKKKKKKPKQETAPIGFDIPERAKVQTA